MTRDECSHGHLRRKCDTCAFEAEIALLHELLEDIARLAGEALEEHEASCRRKVGQIKMIAAGAK